MSFYTEAPLVAEYLRGGAQDWQARRPTVFTRDRSKSVGASEVFQCPRYVYFTKQEIKKQQDNNEPPPRLENGGFMLRGKILEDNFIAPFMGELFDGKIKNLGDEQETYVAEDCEFLTATPDGIGVCPFTDKKILWEFKTFDPRVGADSLPKAAHVLQTHVQMGVTGIDTTYLCYFNASDLFDIRVFEINFNETVYDNAKERATNVMRAQSPEELDVTEAVIKGECEYCKYREKGLCNGE